VCLQSYLFSYCFPLLGFLSGVRLDVLYYFSCNRYIYIYEAIEPRKAVKLCSTKRDRFPCVHMSFVFSTIGFKHYIDYNYIVGACAMFSIKNNCLKKGDTVAKNIGKQLLRPA
jgi:hypothetical protein